MDGEAQRPLPPRSRVYRECHVPSMPALPPMRSAWRWRVARLVLLFLGLLAVLAMIGVWHPARATTLRDALAARRAAAASAAAPTPQPPASGGTTAVPAASPASVVASGAGTAAALAAGSSVCRASVPFYWEVGNRTNVLAAGTVGDAAPARNTAVNIASASKWLYAAYVVQLGSASGIAADTTRPYLNLTAGYTQFSACRPGQTVAQCSSTGTNGKLDSGAMGRFSYGGGHMQRLAALSPLGAYGAPQLGTEISRVLGVPVRYVEAQLAGGAQISAADYATFLRRLMGAELALGRRLGESPVCTEPKSCQLALRSPVPVRWQYSLGHWVESPDGDGAFSSPGAFGFYPWISADKTLYGVLARSGKPAAWQSARCGAAIRAAFVRGT